MTCSPNQLRNLIGELKQRQTHFINQCILFKNASDQAGYLDEHNIVFQKPNAAIHIEHMKTYYIHMEQQKDNINSILQQLNQFPNESFQRLSQQDFVWLQGARNNISLWMQNELTAKSGCLSMLGVDCEWNK